MSSDPSASFQQFQHICPALAVTLNYPPFPDRPSIAVLPFQNMSGDSEQDYFADGMVDDIITQRSRGSSRCFVIARNSSFTYKGKAVDIKQVGREPSASAMCWRAAFASPPEEFASPVTDPCRNRDAPLGGSI